MDYSGIILFLFPANRETRKTMHIEKNKSMRVENWELVNEGMTLPNGDAEGYCLAVRFDQSHGNRGVVFGSSEDADIVLTQHRNISRHHCYITFDDLSRLCLIDCSTEGTRLSYNSRQGAKKKNFKWLLNPPSGPEVSDPLTLEITYHIKFKVLLWTYDTDSQDYLQLVRQFHDNALPEMPYFIRQAQTMHGSHDESPADDEDCYFVKKVGEGAFGKVKRVWNVSTGDVYALKIPSWRNQTAEHKQKWKKEIAIMMENEHEHIIKCYGKAGHSDPGHEGEPDRSKHPGIIFEYAPFGSLHDYYNKEGGYASTHGPLTTYEAETIMYQLLSALKFLHGPPEPVCHRDIKPGNILIMKPPWSPDGIFVKFADFGLAKAGEIVTTNCGTFCYAAPELYSYFARGRTAPKYIGAKVDIYSLGIVIAELVCKIPQWNNANWHTEVQNEVSMYVSMSDKGSHTADLLSFILDNMLPIDPNIRKSASQCLERATNGAMPSTPPYQPTDPDPESAFPPNVSTPLTPTSPNPPGVGINQFLAPPGPAYHYRRVDGRDNVQYDDQMGE